MLSAVNVGAVATPEALVDTTAVRPPFVPPVNVPLAPLDGAVKVTEAPDMPLPLASVTVTAKDVKAVFTATLCEPPLVIASFEAGPGVFVREKEALVETPVTDAVTE